MPPAIGGSVTIGLTLDGSAAIGSALDRAKRQSREGGSAYAFALDPDRAKRYILSAQCLGIAGDACNASERRRCGGNSGVVL